MGVGRGANKSSTIKKISMLWNAKKDLRCRIVWNDLSDLYIHEIWNVRIIYRSDSLKTVANTKIHLVGRQEVRSGQLGQWWHWTSKLKLLTNISFGEGTISSSLCNIIFGILVARDCRTVSKFKSHSSHMLTCGLCNKVAYKTISDILSHFW
jgi:hypothetical protein